MLIEINNLNDVAEFVRALVNEGINAHPDELFENYINIETGEPTFTVEEALDRNQLMDKSFQICEKAGVDIYSFMQDIYLTETGMDKFIPKSIDVINLD